MRDERGAGCRRRTSRVSTRQAEGLRHRRGDAENAERAGASICWRGQEYVWVRASTRVSTGHAEACATGGLVGAEANQAQLCWRGQVPPSTRVSMLWAEACSTGGGADAG
jgi:hypothetical protein